MVCNFYRYRERDETDEQAIIEEQYDRELLYNNWHYIILNSLKNANKYLETAVVNTYGLQYLQWHIEYIIVIITFMQFYNVVIYISSTIEI